MINFISLILIFFILHKDYGSFDFTNYHSGADAQLYTISIILIAKTILNNVKNISSVLKSKLNGTKNSFYGHLYRQFRCR